MERGIPTEGTLRAMPAGEPSAHYLVGTPKGRLTRPEESFVGLPWRAVRESVEVKFHSEDGEFYVLARPVLSGSRVGVHGCRRHGLGCGSWELAR